METTPEELAQAILSVDNFRRGFAYDVASSLADANPVKEFPGPDPQEDYPATYHLVVNHLDAENVRARITFMQILRSLLNCNLQETNAIKKDVMNHIPTTILSSADKKAVDSVAETLSLVGVGFEIQREGPPVPEMHTLTFMDRFRIRG